MGKPVAVESETGDQQSEQADGAEKNGATSIARDPVPLMDHERGLVGWDSPTDTENPRNWARPKKAHLMVCMGIISTISPLASSMVAPGIAFTMEEFRESSHIVGSFMVSIYVLGFFIGPLFLGPLSEIYGRQPVVVLSTWFFNAWLLGSALAPSMASLIVMRLLAGVGGSAVMTIAPAIVADLYPVEKRGSATSLIILAQSAGPAVGPICGGFISQYLGWRWLYWVLLMAAGSTTIVMTVYMPESYAPRVLQTKARRMQKETGRTDLHPLLNQKLSARTLLARSIARPTKMLTRSPIVFSICAYVATIYGFIYLMFTTIPTVFEQTYGWPASYSGLAYTPLAVGMIAALCVIMRTSDAAIVELTKRNNYVYEPEMRLSTTVYYAAFIPVSLFWYGWSADQAVHWAVPIVGMLPFGWGMIGIFMSCQTYLVDVFPSYAASAVAASRASLSIMGAFLPLAGPPLYQSLGIGGGNTVLGAVALVMTPIPFLLYKYGGKIRRQYMIDM